MTALLPGMTRYDVLVAIRDEQVDTQAKIIEWLGLSRTIVSRHIVSLQKAGLIEVAERVGSGSGRPAYRYRGTAASQGVTDPRELSAAQGMLKRLVALEDRVRFLEARS